VAVILAPRFFPSSKACHVCGTVKEDLTLADREWTCVGCGTVHDRDLNAAKNLEQYGRVARNSTTPVDEDVRLATTCVVDSSLEEVGTAMCTRRPGEANL